MTDNPMQLRELLSQCMRGHMILRNGSRSGREVSMGDASADAVRTLFESGFQDRISTTAPDRTEPRRILQ